MLVVEEGLEGFELEGDCFRKMLEISSREDFQRWSDNQAYNIKTYRLARIKFARSIPPDRWFLEHS